MAEPDLGTSLVLSRVELMAKTEVHHPKTKHKKRAARRGSPFFVLEAEKLFHYYALHDEVVAGF